MFTGLIEEVGKVKAIKRGLRSIGLTIGCRKVLTDVKQGDSIATNGVCLTVVAFENDAFTADVMPETMAVTAFKALKIGDTVNLERALKVGDRLGGHVVSGHVDDVGIIRSFKDDGIATWLTIESSSTFMKYLIHKGSIAIDGVSLTVAKLDEGTFQVSMIPATKAETTLLAKKVGDAVNLEGDVLGKYVERLLSFGGAAFQMERGPKYQNFAQDQVSAAAGYNASLNFLESNGFL
ncbi:MAG: riboflavin synthase [Clostridia bacterium]|nr:riboflavin synthase [Clostridia bacterium]